MRVDSPRSDFFRAAKAPDTLAEQDFGLWAIMRQDLSLQPIARYIAGRSVLTVLYQWTEATIHHGVGHIVMEDSRRELNRHLPMFFAAHGRVLITGLGLGCVVRGLLIKPEVEHIDVIEIDADIIRVVGPEFADNPRVTIHHDDALKWPIGDRIWDVAWHDICTPDDVGLQGLHGKLLKRFWPHCQRQGAWDFPREVSRGLPYRLIGAPKTPRQRRAA